MCADGGAGPAIAGPFPVVQAFPGARGQILRDHLRGEGGRVGRNVVKHPVDPDHFGGRRVRGVGVIDDKREALRPFRGGGPGELGRDIFAVAGVAQGNLAIVLECGGLDCQGHGVVPLAGGTHLGGCMRVPVMRQPCRGRDRRHDETGEKQSTAPRRRAGLHVALSRLPSGQSLRTRRYRAKHRRVTDPSPAVMSRRCAAAAQAGRHAWADRRLAFCGRDLANSPTEKWRWWNAPGHQGPGTPAPAALQAFLLLGRTRPACGERSMDSTVACSVCSGTRVTENRSRS